MSAPLIPLAEAADYPIEAVGGKAQALSRMMRAGFDVPDGFVVPSGTTPTVHELAMRLEPLGPGPYAVRSSGASEDAAESSLAGRYLSLLRIYAGSIEQAVADVRASAHVTGQAIGVIVQRMIEPVCSGVAFTADPVTGERDKTIVTATAGLADRLLSGQVAGDNWEVTGPRARATRRPERVASGRLVRHVARTARDVAERFGSPQDVEWAWDGNDLWLVQSRPITGLPEEVSWRPPAPGIYQRSLRFGEWIPEPVTPLFESWLLSTMERRVHDRLHELIGQVAPEPLHVIVNGWYFYSLNWLPVPGVAFGRNFFTIMRRVWKDWRVAAPMFPQTVRFGYQRYEDDWRDNILPRYRAKISEAEATLQQADAFELMQLVDAIAEEAGDYFGSIATVAGSAYKFEQQLASFWNKHVRKKLDMRHVVVLQGLDLPPEIDDVPRLESLDWAVPPARPYRRPADTTDLKARREHAMSEALDSLSGSERRSRKLRRLVSEAQHMVPVREEQLALLALAWPVMRSAIHRLGETLASTGSIDAADDIYYLTRDEVESLLERPQSVEEVVSTRREERTRAGRLAAPLWVGNVPPTVKFAFSYSNRVMGAVRSNGAIVHGVPTSPGRVTGRVRIVRDSSEFDQLEDGEILVAPLTAPAWTQLFERASAVVTDVGSALAHASIIAREYGIPAVVGCGDATSRLHNGQLVTVDGSTGNIEPALEPQA